MANSSAFTRTRRLSPSRASGGAAKFSSNKCASRYLWSWEALALLTFEGPFSYEHPPVNMPRADTLYRIPKVGRARLMGDTLRLGVVSEMAHPLCF